MLFSFFSFFTKLDQMSRVGSRGRHPKCRPKNISKLLREHILCLFLGLIDYKKKLISEKESKKKLLSF